MLAPKSSALAYGRALGGARGALPMRMRRRRTLLFLRMPRVLSRSRGARGRGRCEAPESRRTYRLDEERVVFEIGGNSITTQSLAAYFDRRTAAVSLIPEKPMNALFFVVIEVVHVTSLSARAFASPLTPAITEVVTLEPTDDCMATFDCSRVKVLIRDPELFGRYVVGERYALLVERRESVLPGWTCDSCGAFNGDAKEKLGLGAEVSLKLSACRACEARRPARQEGDTIADAIRRIPTQPTSPTFDDFLSQKTSHGVVALATAFHETWRDEILEALSHWGIELMGDKLKELVRLEIARHEAKRVQAEPTPHEPDSLAAAAALER